MKPYTKTFYLLSFFSLALCLSIYTSCKENPYQQGEILYNHYCANCHIEDGTGLKGLIPPLANADWVKNNPTEMACLIRNGMKGEIVVNGKTYNQEMVGFPQLTRYELANIINYINQAWGNDYGTVKVTDIKEELEVCSDLKF